MYQAVIKCTPVTFHWPVCLDAFLVGSLPRAASLVDCQLHFISTPGVSILLHYTGYPGGNVNHFHYVKYLC